MKRKILALVTAIVTIFSATAFAGCAGNNDSGKDSGSGSQTGSGSQEQIYKAPEMTLSYDEVYIAENATYDLLDGVTVKDEYDADLKATADKSSSDIAAAGDYTVTYKAKNSKGKEVSKTRTIHVIGAVIGDRIAVKKGGKVMLPTFTKEVPGSELTVEYKGVLDEDYTAVETDEAGDYIIDLAAADYDVKYTLRDTAKLNLEKTVKVTVYEAATHDKLNVVAGGTYSFAQPAVSENVVAVRVEYKKGDGEFTAITANEESGKYDIADFTAGKYEVKYTFVLVEEDEETGVKELSAEYVTEINAIAARLESTNIEQITADKATNIELRLPVVSEGVTYSATIRELLPDAQATALTKNDAGKFILATIAEGQAYEIKYTYTYADGTDLGWDSYMVYFKPTKNVLDMENEAMFATPYDTVKQNFQSNKHSMSGHNSHEAYFYYATYGNWHGYKSLSIAMEGEVNHVTFYAYSDTDIDYNFGLWIETDTGSNAYGQSGPDASKMDSFKVKAGWNKYTLDLHKTFSTLKTYTFYCQDSATAIAAGKSHFIYFDDMWFYKA